jgi:tRNA1(Val) A37 N6-methylase TrmN6
MTATGITEDVLLDGRLRLRQLADGHRAGTDALLLAAFAPAGGRVCDLGSGTGAVGLAMVVTGKARNVTLAEREPALVTLARENIALNGLGTAGEAISADVFASAANRARCPPHRAGSSPRRRSNR